MLEEIKKYFFQKKLKSDIQSNRSKRLLKDFADMTDIGIAFDGTEYEMITTVRDLERKFKQEGKNVSLYVYLNSNDDKKQPYLITNKNLNWFGYPTKNHLFEFANKEFDLLFGFFNEHESPLNAIFANSKSKLRIGVNYNQDYELFDIIVESDKIKNTEDIITSLTQFITRVKTK